MTTITCEEVVRDHLQHLEGRFTCRRAENRLWIISPYAYPDSDLLEVAVVELGSGEVRVTDLGETLRHLADLGCNPRATPKGDYLLQEILKQNNAELERGTITKKTVATEVGRAAQDVLMACFAIAAIAHLGRV